MTLERHNLQSHGWEVLQDLDATDQFGVAYDDIDVLRQNLQYGARYGWIIDDDGIPIYTQIEGTDGPIGGWFVVPGIGGDDERQMGQWFQVAAAKISDVGPPLLAAVVLNAAGDLDTSLDTVEVATLDGSTPAVDAIGVIVRGSKLGSQELIFFQGGGASDFPAAITTIGGSMSGVYDYAEVDPFDNSALGGGRTGSATELNRSQVISAGQVVVIKHYGTVAHAAADYFFYPLAKCP